MNSYENMNFTGEHMEASQGYSVNKSETGATRPPDFRAGALVY